MKAVRHGMSFNSREVLWLSELLAVLRRGGDTSGMMRRDELSNVSALVQRAALRAADTLKHEQATRAAADAAARLAMAELSANQVARRMNSHCRNGHLFTEQTTLRRLIDGKRVRVCRTCIKNSEARKAVADLRQRQEAALDRMVAERRVG
jgi:fatty acid-binding protein DegV